MGEHIQKTLVIIKPDGVQRTLVGEIIQRFEKVGLKLIAMKMVRADTDTVERHYLSDPNWREVVGAKVKNNIEKDGGMADKTPTELGEEVLSRLKNFMTAGPVIPFVLEGASAISLTRKLVGGTEPLSSDVGTIRGDFVLDSYEMADGANRAIRNIIHASSSVEDANAEIAVWFKPEEILEYTTVHERILYDIHFDNVNN